ncbi:MAG: hypothetical protein R3C30_06975 [Hyphomonadaceae bacterium]
MTHVRVRLSQAEVEIESDKLDAEDALQTAIDTLFTLLSRGSTAPDPEEADDTIGSASPAGANEMGINSVVAIVGGGSCREILIAAAAVIGIIQGRARFPRKEWEDVAAAAHMWKASYGSQKSRDIKRLIQSGELIENSKDVFSLAPSLRATLEAQLGR